MAKRTQNGRHSLLAKLKALSPMAFENVVYDCLSQFGLENITWRTPGRDGGRDLEGSYFLTDFSGQRYSEKWYIECKKYSKTIDWPTIREKLSYAESNQADFLLFITTSSISPQAQDELHKWNSINGKPKIRVWPGYLLETTLQNMPTITIKYHLSPNATNDAAISILPLSMLALKFIDAAYASHVFNVSSSPLVEASAALSNLLTFRLEQIEQFGTWYSSNLRPLDMYEWLIYNGGFDKLSIDRHVTRALVCTYKCMVNSQQVIMKDDPPNGILISSDGNRDLSENQRKDLKLISMWGNCEITLRGNDIKLRRRHSDESG